VYHSNTSILIDKTLYKALKTIVSLKITCRGCKLSPTPVPPHANSTKSPRRPCSLERYTRGEATNRSTTTTALRAIKHTTTQVASSHLRGGSRPPRPSEPSAPFFSATRPVGRVGSNHRRRSWRRPHIDAHHLLFITALLRAFVLPYSAPT
jgi:hypothetical protein